MLRGWAGVNQMHEARNAAQHAGVAPDVQQLVAWADAAIGFIDSLCVAAFNTKLQDIVLASAVRDPELRALLTTAKGSVGDDTRQSFSAAEQAFGIARARWRTQRNAAVPSASPTYMEPILASDESQMIGNLTEAVASLEDWLEVQPFAGDLSEYIWFRRVGRERASVGWVPDIDEARRALVFAVGWIVRWEIFTFGYPEERWQDYRDGIEPPTDGGRAHRQDHGRPDQQDIGSTWPARAQRLVPPTRQRAESRTSALGSDASAGDRGRYAGPANRGG